MRTLVVGTNGLLGSNVFRYVQDRGGSAVGTYHTEKPPFRDPCYELDIRDTVSLEEVLDGTNPDLVVNCAAMTDVDGCEENPERAREVNAEAPGEIAQLCAYREIAFTHVSTDYVFDGKGDSPYTVDSTPAALQEYGRTKLAGERGVQRNHPCPTIVRLSFVYGIHKGSEQLEGFPAWVRDRLHEAESIPLFTDQWITPSRAGQTAEKILQLHEQGVTGLYHVASRSCITPYEFGTRICEIMDVPSRYIKEGTMDDVERSVDRPAYTCLDVTSVESATGNAQPTLREDLKVIKPAFH